MAFRMFAGGADVVHIGAQDMLAGIVRRFARGGPDPAKRQRLMVMANDVCDPNSVDSTLFSRRSRPIATILRDRRQDWWCQYVPS